MFWLKHLQIVHELEQAIWQEQTLFSKELLFVSEWLLLYVALCALSQ